MKRDGGSIDVVIGRSRSMTGNANYLAELPTLSSLSVAGPAAFEPKNSRLPLSTPQLLDTCW